MTSTALPAGAEAAYAMLADGVVVLAPSGEIVLVNRAAERILGQQAGVLVGQEASALELEDAQGCSWWSWTDPNGGLRSRTRQPETQLVGRGGVQVLATVSFVRDQERAVEWVVLSLRDAHARQRAEKRSANLISTVAHELRSPLTSVKGFTSTLLKKWERFNDEQKLVMLESVNQDADRVTRLITDLLDVSRIDAGRTELRKRVVDVEEILRRVVEGRAAAGEEAEKFEIQLEGELPEMWADPDKIAQILSNLVENAVRHGEGKVSIALTGTAEGCTITVSDEGPGISEDAQKRVFTRFWRGDRRGGTGLGLYLVKGLTEAHGGRVSVGRAASGGAQFTVVLPAGTPEFM